MLYSLKPESKGALKVNSFIKIKSLSLFATSFFLKIVLLFYSLCTAVKLVSSIEKGRREERRRDEKQEKTKQKKGEWMI